MSVAIPKASAVFGSVTPPQSDIIDLRVHLGCTAEISSFECLLQNFDKKYSPGGTYPINVGSDATISLGRDPNCPLVLTGKVEEIEPLSDALEHYIRVRGRCNGEQLFRRLVTKSWDNVKGEVVIKYVIDNYTSLSHVRDSVELVEDTDTIYTHLEYDDTPVFDIIKYIAETADLAGAIGYDFRIAPDGKFEFFPKNSKTSSVDLSERLEVSEYKKDIFRVRNKITVYGARGRNEPADKDAYTEESLDGWAFGPGEGSLSGSNPKVGLKYIHVTSEIDLNYTSVARLTLPSSISGLGNKGFQTLNFYIRFNGADSNLGGYIQAYAPGLGGFFRIADEDMVIGSTWKFNQIKLGRSQEKSDDNPAGKWLKFGNADWSDITKIEFYFFMSLTYFTMDIDGIYFGDGRFRATVTGSGDLREKTEVDEELFSDAECEYRAKALLDFLKDPIETLKVRSEVVDYGTTPILAADKIHVTVPNENIDGDYRLISVEYKASGRDQTLEVELELAKEPQLLADFIYGFRKSILKLDKYKASASGGVSGSVGGGGGGGSMVQHANEWHNPDMALQSDFASHKDRHKSGGADAFVLADLLDCVARVKVRKNSGSDIGARRRINIIEGSNIALTIADDPTDEEIDMTLKSGVFAVLTPLGAVLPSSGAPAQTKGVGTNFVYYILDFDAAVDEVCYFQFKLPPNYVVGSSIVIVIQWISAVTTGAVVWAAQFLGRANGEAYDSALGSVQSVTTNAPATTGQIATSEITFTTPDLQANDVVIIKIYRDADNASDTMAADARMVMAGVKL
jgi:hypothetical protein